MSEEVQMKICYMKEMLEKGIEKEALRAEVLQFLEQYVMQHSEEALLEA